MSVQATADTRFAPAMQATTRGGIVLKDPDMVFNNWDVLEEEALSNSISSSTPSPAPQSPLASSVRDSVSESSLWIMQQLQEQRQLQHQQLVHQKQLLQDAVSDFLMLGSLQNTPTFTSTLHPTVDFSAMCGLDLNLPQPAESQEEVVVKKEPKKPPAKSKSASVSTKKRRQSAGQRQAAKKAPQTRISRATKSDRGEKPKQTQAQVFAPSEQVRSAGQAVHSSTTTNDMVADLECDSCLYQAKTACICTVSKRVRQNRKAQKRLREKRKAAKLELEKTNWEVAALQEKLKQLQATLDSLQGFR
eukprot:m.256217 g.256217  ORF g.256217 m.256217 type:complete len:304 (+) comp15513_c3_seq1:182-1093(+)